MSFRCSQIESLVKPSLYIKLILLWVLNVELERNEKIFLNYIHLSSSIIHFLFPRVGTHLQDGDKNTICVYRNFVWYYSAFWTTTMKQEEYKILTCMCMKMRYIGVVIDDWSISFSNWDIEPYKDFVASIKMFSINM